MKILPLLATALFLASPLASLAAADKVKTKDKPVRKAIESWYEDNKAAFGAKDVQAIMALRSDDFHTVLPDGRVNSRADMEARTRQFVARIDRFLLQEFGIGTIEVAGDLASADISQRTVRMQRMPDGNLQEVDSAVVQRETWRKTADGWKLYKVDNIRDGHLLVNGQPWRPN